MPVMSTPDLYGGRICAALDRQHPRDLFDIKILFENEGITADIWKAFVVYLAGHDRPISELLTPSLADIRNIFNGEFQGMSEHPVTLEELVRVRERLVSTIISELTTEERRFLLSLKAGEPLWNLLEIEGIDRPGITMETCQYPQNGRRKTCSSFGEVEGCFGQCSALHFTPTLTLPQLWWRE